MNIKDLYTLCEDLRTFILSNTSKTGGHLASNLGVVEITVAIHNVFDTSRDRLVFDVGHQCYAHKILTGRREGFDALRGRDGISGFPNPDESIHDAFISGHASTSVSIALGMARARTANQEDYTVIALVGDGALTGGLAFEGLSDAGHSGEPLIIILNDNEMSITENVGGLSKHLAYLRMRPYYLGVKKVYRKTFARIPIVGKGITSLLRRIKSGIKETFRLPSSMFENMGFTYLGPADGHNIKEVCRLLKVAEEIGKPVIIHLKTIKGKGYKYAEDNPEAFHGVSEFNVGNGQAAKSTKITFSTAFGMAISDIAKDDKKVCAITAAMKSGTGLDEFAQKFPGQFFDVGIAEGHAVTMAGGLAKQGMLPVCAIYSTFIQRAYDMLFHDVCLSNQHIVFAVDRAGLVPDDGQTHQGIYDIGIFLQMPNVTVLCPYDTTQMREMLRFAVYDVKGPVAVRYPRGGGYSGDFEQPKPPYEPVLIREGKDAVIVTYGRLIQNAIEASTILEKQGTIAAVVLVTDVSNISVEKITNLTGKGLPFFMIEECVMHGCVASKLALDNSGERIIPINLGNAIPPPATTMELMGMYGLDGKSIADFIIDN